MMNPEDVSVNAAQEEDPEGDEMLNEASGGYSADAEAGWRI